MISTAAGWGWRPGRGTATILLLSALLAGWLFTPTWATERGVDAKDYYAAASLANRGGNPYDPAEQGAEQDRLFNKPSDVSPGQAGYARAPYGYPPLFTLLLRRAMPLGFDRFYLLTLALLTAAGLLGMEALLHVVGWQRRWLARAFFLASAPMALSLFVGNPSPLLLLGWAGALLLVRKGRPFLGGILLTLCLLKLPVGLPAAFALLVAPGTGSLMLGLGLAVGSGAVAGLQLLLTGADATVSWLHALGGYTSGLGPGGGSAFAQSGLAGVPALFLDHVPTALAVALALLLIGTMMAWAWRRLATMHQEVSPDLILGVIVVAAVGATPYLHLNDLVILALPLLLLAQTAPTVIARITELAWFIGIPAQLFLLGIAAITLHFRPAFGSAGIGVLLLLLLLLSLPIAARPSGALEPGS